MLAKIWKYTWNVLYHLVSIGIMLALFGSANTNFETCVIYMLVNIYLSVTSGNAFLSLQTDFNYFVMNRELLIYIAEKLGIETTALREDLKESRKISEDGTVLVNAIFTSIKYLIAFVCLLKIF